MPHFVAGSRNEWVNFLIFRWFLSKFGLKIVIFVVKCLFRCHWTPFLRSKKFVNLWIWKKLKIQNKAFFLSYPYFITIFFVILQFFHKKFHRNWQEKLNISEKKININMIQKKRDLVIRLVIVIRVPFVLDQSQTRTWPKLLLFW